MTEISFCGVIVLQKQNRMSFVKCILVFLAGFILGAQIICPKWVYHRQNQPKTPPNLSLPLWFPRKRLVSPSYLILRKFYPPPPSENDESMFSWWWWWWWWWWWIVFVLWLTDERRLTLFPAVTIVRGPYHRKTMFSLHEILTSVSL